MNTQRHHLSLFSTFSRWVFIALLLLSAGLQSAYAERKTTYYHTDVLGSVVAASNDSGALLWRKEYAPFGEQLDSTAEQEKLAYTGKQHDDVTGLTYFGARYYDPHLGRFMGVDPVGFVESNPTSFNRYAYVNNNPYKYVDPDGEFLNFAAKFVLDVGINVAFNYVTTGQMDVGGALKESAVGIFNPAKTVAKAGELLALAAKARKSNVVYRGLAKGENPADGLAARAPGAGNSELSHVAGKRESQWISTTKSREVATKKYGENGVVEIDLNKVDTEVSDVSKGFPRGGRFSNYAKKDQEVLIKDRVPPGAVRRVD
jgi:RHS repeat-associated protein